MQKIKNLFQFEEPGHRITDRIQPDSQWVVDGKGIATRKFNGACCRILDGVLWKRYEVKKGKKPPEGFEPACEVDPNTGKQQGWVLVNDGPEDKWFREALIADRIDGTYELCGPKVQGNPEGFSVHRLIPHGRCPIGNGIVPTDFEGLRDFFKNFPHEGIVWHHPDGRMVKCRRKDFGF